MSTEWTCLRRIQIDSLKEVFENFKLATPPTDSRKRLREDPTTTNAPLARKRRLEPSENFDENSLDSAVSVSNNPTTSHQLRRDDREENFDDASRDSGFTDDVSGSSHATSQAGTSRAGTSQAADDKLPKCIHCGEKKAKNWIGSHQRTCSLNVQVAATFKCTFGDCTSEFTRAGNLAIHMSKCKKKD